MQMAGKASEITSTLTAINFLRSELFQNNSDPF